MEQDKTLQQNSRIIQAGKPFQDRKCNQSAGICVRTARAEDAEQLLEIYSVYVKKTAISFEYEIPTIEEFQKRIRTIVKKYPYIVAEQDGTIVGYAYADAFKGRKAYDWAVETTIYVDQNQHHKNIGRTLYEALERCLKKQGILNLNACIASTETEDAHLTNASARFHQRMGYSLVGKFHKCGYKFNTWYDMIWMEKMIGEHTSNQPEIRPYEDQFLLE